MRKVVIRVCMSCKKCHGKVLEHLKKIEGVKDIIDIPGSQKVEVIGDFQVVNVLTIFDHGKLQKKYAIEVIEELPPPPKPEPPKAPPEDKPKDPPKKKCKHDSKAEEPPKKCKHEDPPKKCKHDDPPPKKWNHDHDHDHGHDHEHDHEPPAAPHPKKEDPPKKKKPALQPDHDHDHEHEHEHEHEPESFCFPPTIIISDPLPTSYPYQHEPADCSKYEQEAAGGSFDMAILIGLVLLVMVLLASVTSSSTASSMTEAAGAFMTGFIESTIATLGSLFLIVLALFAIMGFLCLADPKPQPCSC